MGTSASSNGPGAGVSLDPEWLDDIDIPGNLQATSGKSDIIPDKVLPLIAPKARFSNARRNMGEYVQSGSKDSLRRALGHYSKTGMGGARNLSNRMRTSAKVASNFVRVFRSLRDDSDFALGRIISNLKERGASASELVKVIVDSVCPNGGSLDEISPRDSGTAALSEFMDKNPDADICCLSDDQIWTFIGRFLGNEAFGRVQHDIGQSFEKMGISLADKIVRMNEMKDFLQSDIATQLDKVRESTNQIINLEVLFRDAIKNTFEVYEVEV